MGRLITYCENSLKLVQQATAQLPGQGNQDQDFRIRSVNRLINLCTRDKSDNTTIEDLARRHIATWDEMTDSATYRFLKRFKVSKFLPVLYYYCLFILALNVHSKGDFCRFMDRDADRCVARTFGGRLCSVPHTSRAGDQIALLRGGRHPYLIRKVGDL
jgi:hypothetical protein